MKKQILNFLKNHPKLYNFAEHFYSLINRVVYFFQGSKSVEKYWEERHQHKKDSKKDDWGNAVPAGRQENINWIEAYRNSTSHAHRKYLIEKISSFNPSSILEIGCNCGPNLFLLAKKFPEAIITGIDINPMAVKMGNEWFEQEGLKNVKLITCKADELEQFTDNYFDIVFTDAVLIYFGTDNIKKVITEMFRVTRKTLILFEWNDFSNEQNSLGRLIKHWVRNYKTLLKEFTSEKNIKIEKIPDSLWTDKNWQKYGALIEVYDLNEKLNKTKI